MNPLLADLLAHRAWADAVLARAFASHPTAATDPVLRNRWHHMIAVQRNFLWLIGGLPRFDVPAPDALPTLAALAAVAQRTHDDERAYAATLTEAQLHETVAIPHFQNPPLAITRAEVLMQSALHSQHHRAQNATRLRELGAVPPTTDLIVWYWQARPAASWESGV